jgi:hypothetical protein
VNDKIVRAAQELLKRGGGEGYTKLRQIVSGKVKSVDPDWWRRVNGVAPWQLSAKLEKKTQARLDAIKALADPAGNPNAHERRVAEAMLAKLQAAKPPKVHTRSPPGFEEYDRLMEKRRAAVKRDFDARIDEMLKAAAARRGGNTAKPARLLNTTKQREPEPEAPAFNTTKHEPKPRSADRHLEPNRDRHSPGYMREYMREYMRRRRAAAKPARAALA